VISANITEILDAAFAVSGLEELSFETNSQLETIGSSAFMSCYDLRKVVIPVNITEILKYAFFGSGLVEVSFAAISK